MKDARQFDLTHKKARNEAGFTLIELMVVVAIIGILTAVAAPRVQAFRARGVQSEAKANLSSIFLAQTNFFEANERYADIGVCNPGVACAGGDGAAFTYQTNNSPKYSYVGAGGGAGAGGWSAGASSIGLILRGQRDQWRINSNRVLCAINDSVRGAFRDCPATNTVATDGTPNLDNATDVPN